MADLASGDVTYTLVKRRKVNGGPSRYHHTFTVAFGDGALTYPSGGVPLTAAKLGCPNSLEELNLVDAGSGDGNVFKWDKTNNKLRMYEFNGAAAGDSPLLELDAASDAVTAVTLTVEAVGY